MRQKIRYLNMNIFIPYLLLVIFGVILVYSSSSTILLQNGFNPSIYGVRQAIYAIVAFALFGVPFFALKLEVFKNPKFVVWFLGISIALLMWLVGMKLVHGSSAAVNGAVGWINLGFINLQPLEVAKLALVIYLAFVLNKRDGKIVKGNIINELKHPAILTGFMMALVIVEPDFGGTAILFMIAFVMFSISGVPARTVFKWTIVMLAILLVGIFILLTFAPSSIRNSYQYSRFLSVLHPFELERKGGAQLVNSFYAIHNGGIGGVGLGNSMQKRGYLPEPYTDFILSIAAEELGFIGILIILGLMFWLLWNIMEVGIKAQSQYNSLVCFGVTTIIFTEALFNIGAVVGLLPITGVTLPFISYGGSSLIVLTACIGLVLNISANEKAREEKEYSVA